MTGERRELEAAGRWPKRADAGWRRQIQQPDERAPHPKARPEHLGRRVGRSTDASGEGARAVERPDPSLQCVHQHHHARETRYFNVVELQTDSFGVQAKHATPSAPSVSAVTRRSPSTSPSVAPKQRKSSSAASKSRSTSCGSVISARPATSASVSLSTSIWASSTTPRSVSTAWTSTAACKL